MKTRKMRTIDILLFVNSTISPSDWDSIKTLTFIPYTNWPAEMYVVEIGSEKIVQERTQMEPGAVVTAHVNFESIERDNWQTDRMDEYAITINLDDYR